MLTTTVLYPTISYSAICQVYKWSTVEERQREKLEFSSLVFKSELHFESRHNSHKQEYQLFVVTFINWSYKLNKQESFHLLLGATQNHMQTTKNTENTTFKVKK